MSEQGRTARHEGDRLHTVRKPAGARQAQVPQRAYTLDRAQDSILLRTWVCESSTP